MSRNVNKIALKQLVHTFSTASNMSARYIKDQVQTDNSTEIVNNLKNRKF